MEELALGASELGHHILGLAALLAEKGDCSPLPEQLSGVRVRTSIGGSGCHCPLALCGGRDYFRGKHAYTPEYVGASRV